MMRWMLTHPTLILLLGCVPAFAWCCIARHYMRDGPRRVRIVRVTRTQSLQAISGFRGEEGVRRQALPPLPEGAARK